MKSRELTVLMYSTAYNLWTFTWFVNFELPFRLKGTEKCHTERLFKFPSYIYSILYDCRYNLKLIFKKSHQLLQLFPLNLYKNYWGISELYIIKLYLLDRYAYFFLTLTVICWCHFLFNQPVTCNNP